MKKTVSITGFGWLGKYLESTLKEKGYFINVSATTKERVHLLQQKGMDAYCVNINHPNEIDPLFLNSSVHIIAIPPSKVGNNYAQRIHSFIQQLPKEATIVFISSTSVYPQESGQYSETSNVIHSSISETENIIIHQTANHIILRCSGLIDEERHPANFLSGKTNLEGPLSTVNLVHGEDVALALACILEKKEIGIFNINRQAPLPKKAFYEKMCLLKHKALPNFKEDSGSVERIIQTEKLQRLLGFTFPKTNEFYNEAIGRGNSI